MKFVFIVFVFTNLGDLHVMTIEVYRYDDQLISFRGRITSILLLGLTTGRFER